MNYNKFVSQNNNQIIKQKLKKRLRMRVLQRVLNYFHISFRSFFIFGVPTMALIFTTFLAWQVSIFNYSPLKIANANSQSVLGVSNSISQKETKDVDQNITEKILDIDYIKQIYPLSCEAASLQMALKYYKIDVDQDKILQQVGYSEPKELTEQNGKYIWGDPDLGFVGDPKGWFFNTKDGQESLKYASGWGVNNGPILKVAKLYRPNSYLVNNGTIDQVKTALNTNNPVIWWHRRDDIFQEKLQITTPKGRVIEYQQMHVAVVFGYYQKDGATYYKINDPYFGPYDLDETSFLRYWQRHDNQLVVVA